nr:Mrp/NBP35 family ATP-binding protein [Desulfospira joergensenii]
MERPPRPAPDARVLEKIKHSFIVMSGKGGVGKSSVSANLAVALANKGYKVGLMDIDIHGPDIPRMLGLREMIRINGNKKMEPVSYSPNLSAVSIESLMPDKDTAIIWRGPVKHTAIRQFIGDVDWGPLDFLIIDSPPGTGDEPLTIANLIQDARAIIVTTPQEVALADVRKSIRFCREVDMEIFGLVENMSGFACPCCGRVLDPFGTGGGQRTAIEAGIPFLGKIPMDPAVVACGDAGISFQDRYPKSGVTGAFKRITDKMGRLLNKRE